MPPWGTTTRKWRGACVDRRWLSVQPGSEYAIEDLEREGMADGVRWRLRGSGRIVREMFDRDHDGKNEDVHLFDRDCSLQTRRRVARPLIFCLRFSSRGAQIRPATRRAC